MARHLDGRPEQRQAGRRGRVQPLVLRRSTSSTPSTSWRASCPRSDSSAPTSPTRHPAPTATSRSTRSTTTSSPTAYAQFRWQRQERADALAAGRDPVVAVSDTLDPTALPRRFLLSHHRAHPVGASPKGPEHDPAIVLARFEGRVAAVIGGGSGMGRAISHRLAAEGAYVYVVDLQRRCRQDRGRGDPRRRRPGATRAGQRHERRRPACALRSHRRAARQAARPAPPGGHARPGRHRRLRGRLGPQHRRQRQERVVRHHARLRPAEASATARAR